VPNGPRPANTRHRRQKKKREGAFGGEGRGPRKPGLKKKSNATEKKKGGHKGHHHPKTKEIPSRRGPHRQGHAQKALGQKRKHSGKGTRRKGPPVTERKDKDPITENTSPRQG